MKKIVSLLLLSIASIFVYGQSHLRVISVSGLPVFPSDSITENTGYNISVQISNEDSATFSDTIDVFLRTDTANAIDTLVYNSVNTTIQPFDSTTLQTVNYIAKTTHYDDGDNIVVVWPQARSLGGISDSLSFHVYFIPLNAGFNNPSENPIILYPNPFNSYIGLKMDRKMNLKRVRIYNDLGQICLDETSPGYFIPVSFLEAGTYWLEVIGSNNSRQVFKIIKE